MRKTITALVLCFTLALASTPIVASASEFSDIKAIVAATVSSAYDLDCTEISVEQNEDRYFCSFDTNESSGYATVHCEKNDISVEKIWLENIEYKDSEYIGSSDFEQHTLTVSYADKSESAKKLALTYPAYTFELSCVPKSAACIVGFFDRYYPNLFPNFEPGKEYYGVYSYTSVINDYVIEEANQLAADMGATSITDGVTIDEFKTGFQKFCSRKSLTATYTSCMSSGSFNFESAKTQFEQNKPLIIFMSEFNITSLSGSDGKDTISMYTATAPHSMAAFGYRSVTYTLNNGQTRTDNYLQVSTGDSDISQALLNLSYYIDIDDAYAVTIA